MKYAFKFPVNRTTRYVPLKEERLEKSREDMEDYLRIKALFRFLASKVCRNCGVIHNA
jgi:hypothetical protein